MHWSDIACLRGQQKPWALSRSYFSRAPHAEKPRGPILRHFVLALSVLRGMVYTGPNVGRVDSSVYDSKEIAECPCTLMALDARRFWRCSMTETEDVNNGAGLTGCPPQPMNGEVKCLG